jgi:adenine phosphoribosyltransferase
MTPLPSTEALRALLRPIPDFPKPGILFQDITPLLGDAASLAAIVTWIVDAFRSERITHVVGVESRGFVLAAPVAIALGAGFVPVRKPGTLPAEVLRAEYRLEYGSGTLEIHKDSLRAGDRALLVDDVLATGGTMAASVSLVKRLGASIVGCAFLLEIVPLSGRTRLDGERVESLLSVG